MATVMDSKEAGISFSSSLVHTFVNAIIAKQNRQEGQAANPDEKASTTLVFPKMKRADSQGIFTPPISQRKRIVR